MNICSKHHWRGLRECPKCQGEREGREIAETFEDRLTREFFEDGGVMDGMDQYGSID